MKDATVTKYDEIPLTLRKHKSPTQAELDMHMVSLSQKTKRSYTRTYTNGSNGIRRVILYSTPFIMDTCNITRPLRLQVRDLTKALYLFYCIFINTFFHLKNYIDV